MVVSNPLFAPLCQLTVDRPIRIVIEKHPDMFINFLSQSVSHSRFVYAWNTAEPSAFTEFLKKIELGES